MRAKVLLDTNFILVPAKFKVDIYEEIKRLMDVPYDLYVLDKSLLELENIIRTQKGREREAGKLAKAILEAKKPKTLKTTSKDYVDNIILGLDGFIVATNDSELRAKLKKRGVNRQRPHKSSSQFIQ